MSPGQIILLTIISGDVSRTDSLVDRHLAMSTGQITLLTIISGDVARTDSFVDHISGDVVSTNIIGDYHLYAMSPGQIALLTIISGDFARTDTLLTVIWQCRQDK